MSYVSRQTVGCIVCGSAATVYTGHIHTVENVKAMAGWCKTHDQTRSLADSTVLPFIAKAFPTRVKLQKELTKTAHPDCQGCFGDYAGPIEEYHYPDVPEQS